jgi:hypothetical protein
MFRTLLCLGIAVVLCGDVALAKGKGKGKKPNPITIGTIKSVDAASGSVTVTVTTKKGEKEKSFTVGDTVPVTITKADGSTKDLTGKDGLKNEVVKAGATIQVTCDDTTTVTAVAVGGTYTKPHHGKKKGT